MTLYGDTNIRYLSYRVASRHGRPQAWTSGHLPLEKAKFRNYFVNLSPNKPPYTIDVW